MGNVVNRIKTAILKIVNVFKYIWGFIKGLLSPIGTVLAWILMFIFIIILLQVLFKLGKVALEEIFGTYTIGSHESDMQVLNELSDTGYSTFLDARNLQDYADFEYAMLMDVAKFLMSGEETLKTEVDSLRKNGTVTPVKDVKDYEKIELMSSSGDHYKDKISDFYSRYKNITVDDVPVTTGMDIREYTKGMDEIIKETAKEGKPVLTKTSSEYGSDKVQDVYVIFECKYRKNADGTTSEDKINLIPYLYFIRDEVDYEYCTGKRENSKNNNVLVTMPKELNIYNPHLINHTNDEWAKDIVNKYGGQVVTVSVTDYPRTPYYANESKATMYKIPLDTLIGRYMAKKELLEAWTVAKKEIVDENNPVYKIANNIQKLYIRNSTKENQYSETTVDDKLYLVENEDERSTFLKFGQIGLETTRFTPIESAKSELYGEMTYVVAIEHAVRVDESVITTISNALTAQELLALEESGVEITETTINTTEQQIANNLRAEELLAGIGIKKDDYLFAEEAQEKNTYYSPSSLITTKAYVIVGKTKDDITSLVLTINAELHNITGDTSVNVLEESFEYAPIFLTESTNVTGMVRAINRRMPALFVKSAKTWARDIEYEYEIEQNIFDPDDERYVLLENTYFTGLTKLFIGHKVNAYRTMAYEDVFADGEGNIQEKDVITTLLQLEEYAEDMPDAYEYMREFYKLVKETQDYSVNRGGDRKINNKTFTYVYMPESILYYDDSQTQKIYWTNLLGVAGGKDYLPPEDVSSMQCRDPEITWQVLEYDKYPECEGKVYALFPIGSASVRAYNQLAYRDTSEKILVDGSSRFGKEAYGGGSNNVEQSGADFCGREIAEAVLKSDKDFGTYNKEMVGNVYGYLSANVGNDPTELEYELGEEILNMPIVAVAPGKVINVDFDSINGFYVEVQHTADGNLCTGYYHLKKWPSVAVGDYIGAGTVLGYEGSSGNSKGPHINFRIKIDGKDLSASEVDSYLYKNIFNPFYNEEKAHENSYNKGSRYMSLYRVVDIDAVEDGNIVNNVPDKPLLDNVNSLIQRQGEIDRSYAITGDIGWFSDNKTKIDSWSYSKRYIPDEYTLYELAKEKGYFNAPYALASAAYSNIDILTNSASGLPSITKDEFKEIIEGWLGGKYNEDDYNYIMEKIYTDEVIDKIIDIQNKYNISAIFFIAAAQYESNTGLMYRKVEGYTVAGPDGHNLFNVKGNNNGGITYEGETYNKYDSYIEGIEDFASKIHMYVLDGVHTIKDLEKEDPDFDGKWNSGVSNNVWYALSNLPGYNGFVTAYLWDSADLVEVLKKVKDYIASPEMHGGIKFYYGGHGNSSACTFVEDNKLVYEMCYEGNRAPGCGAQTCNITSIPAYNCVCTDLFRWTVERYCVNKGYTYLAKKWDYEDPYHDDYDWALPDGKRIAGTINVRSGMMIVAAGNAGCMEAIKNFNRFGEGNGTTWMAAMPGDELRYPNHYEVLGPEGVYNTGNTPHIQKKGVSRPFSYDKNGYVIPEQGMREELTQIWRFVDPDKWPEHKCYDPATGKYVTGEELQKIIDSNIGSNANGNNERTETEEQK